MLPHDLPLVQLANGASFLGNSFFSSAMYLQTTRRQINQRFFFQFLQNRLIGRQSVRMASILPRIPVFEAITSHDPQSTAVIHSKSGRQFTYGGILRDIIDARGIIESSAGGRGMQGERVAFLVENGYDYVGAKQVVFGIYEACTD